jgi:hypothetical protein
MRAAAPSPTEAAALSSLEWVKALDPADRPGSNAVPAIALVELIRRLAPTAQGPADACIATLLRSQHSLAWADCDLLPALIAARSVMRVAPEAAGTAEEYLSTARELAAPDGTPGSVLVQLAAGASPGPADDVPCCDPPPPLRHDAPDVAARFLSLVETASRFGTVPCGASEATCQLIEGGAISALRAYDLPLGMRLLRARTCLPDPRSPGLDEGLAFVGAMQRRDGSFGDVDLVLARMPAADRKAAPWRFGMAIAFQALWTMAQIERPEAPVVGRVFAGAALRQRERDAAC